LGLAKTRQVIAFELQAHGRTADIDRPLSLEQMADDTAAAIRQLGLGQADIFGYSMGAGVALHVALRHPDVVRKLVLASVTYTLSGIHPGLMDGLGQMKPEMMHGSPWHEEYMRIAPNSENFAQLFAKKTQMDRGIQDLPAEAIAGITAPTLLIIGIPISCAPNTRSRCFGCSAAASLAIPPLACHARSSPSFPARLT
jgi:pimeloyl-ACP methyl ester carboxylesterase